MTDTQKYIQAYKAALPRLREKVAAAVMMLVISAIMATSATFAWVSLSVNPEVSNIQTTVTANGNLEIALSDVDGLEPEKSQVGDSGKDLVVKNVTWGNLVNLSDPLYGLGKLTLRPAELNTTGDLLTAPLKLLHTARTAVLTSSPAACFTQNMTRHQANILCLTTTDLV